MNIGFISLGCSKNQVDTEIMMAVLKKSGYRLVNSLDKAELVIINTCGFIGPAKEEAIDTILEIGRLKERGLVKYIIAAGCLSQRYGRELLDEIPELDGVIGISLLSSINSLVDRVLKGERPSLIQPPPEIFEEKVDRIITTPPGSAYLKIAEGCNNHCTYCTIPMIKGKFRSRTIDDLFLEAGKLVERGAKEVVLIAQDTSLYGQDIYGRKKLGELVKKLSAIEGLEWIRLMYLHPAYIDKEIIEVVGSERKVIPYMDIPIQHASDKILKRMNRKHDLKHLRALINNLRANIEGLTLRTTVMLGFPGEEDGDFRQLYDFLAETEFDCLGAFTFIAEEDTPAWRMPNPVAEEIKAYRMDEILKLQQKISRQKNIKRINSKERILISSQINKDLYVGRAYFQAPEVDGITMVKTERKLKKGEFLELRIKAVRNYDLVGEIINECTE